LAARRGVSVLDSDLARAATQRERELLKASLPLPASSFVVCPQQGVSNCSPVLTAPIKAYEEKKTRIGRTREMPVGSLSVRSPPAEKVDLVPAGRDSLGNTSARAGRGPAEHRREHRILTPGPELGES
jgi:hypothetical protein